MARILKADGTIQEVSPADGVEFSLEEMRQCVGGHIEAVPYTNLEIMYVNSDGMPDGLPFNKQASELISDARGYAIPVPIFGDALVGTFREMGDEEPGVDLLPIDAQGRLHIVVIRVDEPCSECGSTVYPNLEYNFPFIGGGVLCRACLTKTVDEMNAALSGTWGMGVTWEDPAESEGKNDLADK